MGTHEKCELRVVASDLLKDLVPGVADHERRRMQSDGSSESRKVVGGQRSLQKRTESSRSWTGKKNELTMIKGMTARSRGFRKGAVCEAREDVEEKEVSSSERSPVFSVHTTESSTHKLSEVRDKSLDLGSIGRQRGTRVLAVRDVRRDEANEGTVLQPEEVRDFLARGQVRGSHRSVLVWVGEDVGDFGGWLGEKREERKGKERVECGQRKKEGRELSSSFKSSEASVPLRDRVSGPFWSKERRRLLSKGYIL